SSRRRHTRFSRDWSSDVCSSDLTSWNLGLDLTMFDRHVNFTGDAYYRQVDNQLSDIDLADHNSFSWLRTNELSLVNYGLELAVRSEERRVGKERRCRMKR